MIQCVENTQQPAWHKSVGGGDIPHLVAIIIIVICLLYKATVQWVLDELDWCVHSAIALTPSVLLSPSSPSPFSVLGIEPRASYMLGICSTAELHSGPFLVSFLSAQAIEWRLPSSGLIYFLLQFLLSMALGKTLVLLSLMFWVLFLPVVPTLGT